MTLTAYQRGNRDGIRAAAAVLDAKADALSAEADKAQAQPGYDPLRHDPYLVAPQRLAAGQLRAIAGRLRETLALALPEDPETP